VFTKQSRSNDTSNCKTPSIFAGKLSVGSSTGDCYIRLSCKHWPSTSRLDTQWQCDFISFIAYNVQQWINRKVV